MQEDVTKSLHLQMHCDAILSLEDNITVGTDRLPDTLVIMYENVYALCLWCCGLWQ